MSITQQWPDITVRHRDADTTAAALDAQVTDPDRKGRESGRIAHGTEHGTVTVRVTRVLDGNGWVWHVEAVSGTGVVLSRLETFSSYDAVVEQSRLDAIWALAATWTNGVSR